MSFWSVKRTKRYFFMAVKKSIKNSGFVIYSHLKDSVFVIAAVIGIQSSNLRICEKGTRSRSFFNRRLCQRGAFLWQKLCRKGYKGLDFPA